ncbi:MAG TPA: cytochrome P450 [Candidatus Limnocylindrales bacterium]|nr:cytochrome P450 [Candidatus Limnocylindrales bacterium]
MAVADRPRAPLSLRDLRDVDPYPAYAQMRDAGGILWDDAMAAWLALGHEDCAFVLRHEDLFAEPTGTLPGASEIVGRRDLRSLVGPEHDVLHRALAHAWRPDPIAPLGPGLVRPLLAARLEVLADGETLELFHDVAAIVPIAAIAGVLGLEARDEATLRAAKSWLEAVLAWRHTFGEDAVVRETAAAATRALTPALLPVVRARRDDPRDDTISALWAIGRQVAPDWDEQDVLDNARFLFEGGSETTSLLICTAVDRLLRLPDDERSATVTDRTRLAPFLEEVLRHSSVVHMRARRAVRDVELGGVTIGEGERVIPLIGAANRDPARWPDPDQFDPGRPRLASHLAFSVGPRHCAGAHLARLEATEAIVALFAAFPDLDRDPEAPPPGFLGFVSRAWRPLHLRHAARDGTGVVEALAALR